MPGQEKTEQATPKRRRDERKKGNVFQSREIGMVASLLAIVYGLQVFGPILLQAVSGGIVRFWDMAAVQTSLTDGDLRTVFIQGFAVYAIAALPTLLIAGAVAILLTLAQTKGLFSAKAFAPKFNRLSPAQGLKKIFSVRGAVELLKSLIKIVVLGYVIYNTYMERLPELPRLMEMDVSGLMFYGGRFFMDIVINVSVIFIFLAAADYMFQRWQYEKDLRMSKQELKEEYKQTEGDPHIKNKIREKQRQMAQSRMMSNVPNADVIIRNPTHYAVAVRYDSDANRAPMVIAKGADLVALRIIKLAAEHDIVVVENKPLARGLFDAVPLDREIPEEFYQAVAEVLAFVYSTSKKSKLPKMTDKVPPS